MSPSLVVAPVWKWVHLFGPGSKIVLFANFHQFQIRIFTFDLIFGPETFVLSIFWRVTAQIRIERATQICFNFLDSSTGLVLTPHESWVPFLFPDRVSIFQLQKLFLTFFSQSAHKKWANIMPKMQQVILFSTWRNTCTQHTRMVFH